MFKLEQRDEFARGSVAGAAGAVVKYIFNELMQLLQIAKYDNNATAITVTMSQYERTLFFWLYGFINAVFIGTIFGVLIAFTFSYILTDRFLYKGAALGILIFYLNFGNLSFFFNYPPDFKTLPGDMVSMLLSLMIYALVTTDMLRRLQFFTQE
ncbi:MAG: hypothetical protein Q7J85_06605 [Bacillota bacterium]|nr:hypothetical protein [Bacillota bacterium]